MRRASLLGTSGASRILARFAESKRSELYPYQPVIEARTGVHVRVGGRPYLLVSCYDYLGLLGHPRIEKASKRAVRSWGTGAGGVRLLTGTLEIHRQLEADLAEFLGVEAVLTFSSGYLANLAVLGALFGPRDLVLLDSLVHRSVVDACTLARVPVRRFAHSDVEALRRELEAAAGNRRTLVVVEGVYSMDGDTAPLRQIVELKEAYGALLLVDEAHSLGVLGATGRGSHEAAGLSAARVDVLTGSLSKAIPSQGGFVAGSRDLIHYLQHASAPYIFSAALGPAAAAAALEALRVIRAEPDRGARCRRTAARLRDGLGRLGYSTGASTTPIIPVILGSNDVAFRAAAHLKALGVLASPVLYPAVASGTARLRLCATAAYADEDVDRVVEAFAAVRSGPAEA